MKLASISDRISDRIIPAQDLFDNVVMRLLILRTVIKTVKPEHLKLKIKIEYNKE